MGSSTARRRSSSVDVVAVGALLLVAALASAYRGFDASIRRWGAPNIYLNYSHGLVRRGFVGEVYRLAGLPATPAAFSGGCWLAMLGVIVLSVVLALRARHLHPATVVLLVASQFLPTMAFNNGYLDVYIFVLVLLLYAAVARGWWVAAAVLSFVGPLVHEEFVFFLVPLGLVLLLRWRRGLPVRPHVSALAAAAVTTAAVVLFDSPAAGAQLMAESPLPRSVADAMVSDQLGQTLLPSLTFMTHFWALTWRFALPLGAFMVLPALLMLALNLRRVVRAPWIASALSPLLMLLLAWDLSRIVVMACFLTFVVLCVSESPWMSPTPLPTASAGLTGVMVGALLAFAYYSVPALYAYPSYGYLLTSWNTYVERLINQPQVWPPR